MTSAVPAERGEATPGTPARGARRALLPAAIAGAAVALALLVQLVLDPFQTDIPLCPVYHLTGLHCPGCGAIRSVHALIDGDVLLALRNNVLIVVALPLAAAGVVLWTVRRVQGRIMNLLPPTAVVLALVALVAVFAVLRNLPTFWFIAPTSLVGA